MGRLELQVLGEPDSEIVSYTVADPEDDFVDVGGVAGRVIVLVQNTTDAVREVIVQPAPFHSASPLAAELASDLTWNLLPEDTAVLGPFAPAYIDRDGCVRITYDHADGVDVAAIVVGS